MRRCLNRRLRAFKRLYPWCRHEGGSAATEFAVIAAPFFTVLIAIFETTLVFFAGSTLENAVNDASRTIRTGQAQVTSMSAADFKLMICDSVDALLSCDDNLVVDVRAFDQFEDVSFPPPLTEAGEINQATQFEPGGAGDVVLVRVFYSWPIITPLLGETLSNMAGARRLVSASTAFRNEPFEELLANP